MNKKRHHQITKMTYMALLATLAFLLMFFEFSLPMIAPSFYKIDFSELPVLMGGMLMGPIAAVFIEGMKIMLYLLFRGTRTAFVGEFSNFLLGCLFVIPVCYYYRKSHSKKGLFIGLLMGSILFTFAGYFLNIYVLIPAYVHLAKFPLEAILQAGQAIFPSINSLAMFVMLCSTPFNILKAGMISLLTLLLYPRLKSILYRHHYR